MTSDNRNSQSLSEEKCIFLLIGQSSYNADKRIQGRLSWL